MKKINKTVFLLIALILCAGVAEANAAAIVSGDWTYEGQTIISYTGTQTDVAIPASLDGNSITTVGANVFVSTPGIQNIIVSEGITELTDNAFSGIRNLYSVSLPQSIGSIGEVYGGMPIPVINIPTLEAWMGIDFSGRLSSSSSLYVGGVLLTSYYPQFQGDYELKPYAFYGIKSLKKSILTSCRNIPEYAFAESGIDGIGLNDGLETIGDNAFNNCMLVEIELPESVTSIGNNAFAGNGGLRTIVLNKNLKTIGSGAFTGINAVSKIFSDAVVPPSAAGAFDAYLKLSASLYVPSQSVEEYKNSWAFANILNQIDSVDWTIDDDGTILSYNGTESSIVIPDYIGSTHVVGIAKEIFMNNTSITEVVFPQYIGSVPVRAFKGCTNLKKVVLGSNCQLILRQAFEGCTALGEINLPDRIREIGANAFASSGLTQLTVPAELNTIGADAFLGCNIKNVYVSNIENWLQIAFSNSVSNPLSSGARLYVGGKELTSISLFDNTSVKAYAFNGLKSLTSVRMPGVSVIGDSAFCECSNVKDIVITNVSTIGNYAFYGCGLSGSLTLNNIQSIGISAFKQLDGSAGLSELTLGENLRTIWEGAFLGHNNISKITSSAITPANLMAEKKAVTPVFEQAVRENAILSVPFGSAEYYAHNWDFKNISSQTASTLKILLPDNGCFSLIDPQMNTRVFVGSTDPEWELSAVYLGDDDIYETQITPDGYWIINEIPEGESTLRVVLKKKDGSGITEVNASRSAIKLRKSGDCITIEGASDNAVVRVYDISGRNLLSTRNHSFTLQSKGVVIVTVDNQSFKLID